MQDGEKGKIKKGFHEENTEDIRETVIKRKQPWDSAGKESLFFANIFLLIKKLT